MEMITIGVDCKKETCGNCNAYYEDDNDGRLICWLFHKELKPIYKDGAVIDMHRPAECIGTVELQKTLNAKPKSFICDGETKYNG